MELIRILLVVFLAQLLADFPFQCDKINEEKKFTKKLIGGGIREKSLYEKIEGLLPHIGVHIVVTFTLLFLFKNYLKIDFWDILIIIISISIVHLFIDYSKEKLKLKYEEKGLLLYLVDQIAHLVSIIIIIFIQFESFSDFCDFLKNAYNFSITLIQFNFTTIDKVIILLILIIINTYFSGYLIEFILKKIKPNESNDSNESNESNESNASSKQNEGKKFGRSIGYLERNLYMIFIATNLIEGVAVVIAIKAIARFKQFDDKEFAEYYIVGSFISITMGLLSGIILKYILQ